MFRQLRTIAKTEVLVFVNSDIVLFDGVIAAAQTLESTLKKSVIVGRRLDVPYKVHINARNKLNLERNARKKGVLHGDYGLDYFIMKTEHLPTDFPEFLIGTWRWDNVLLALLVTQGFDILDGTSVITALHQGVNSAEEADHTLRVGSVYNDELAYSYMRRAYLVGRVNAADYELQMHDNHLALVPRPHHELLGLHKCILRQVSMVKPLLVLSTSTLDLKKLKKVEDWILQHEATNYLFLAGGVRHGEMFSKLNAKVCYASIHKFGTHSDLGAALQATNLLKVAQLGIDIAFSLMFMNEHQDVTEVLSPKHFHQSSLHLYDKNVVMTISAGEAGLAYLQKVVQCQRRAVLRVWLCLRCFFSASERRDMLERQYLRCFHRVWTISSVSSA